MAIDDPGEDVGEISLRVDAIHFAGCDQRSQDCPMFCAAIGAGEQMIFAPEGKGTDGALDGVGVCALPRSRNLPVPTGMSTTEEAGATRDKSASTACCSRCHLPPAARCAS